ncbi:MAG: hypothetical protein MZU95_00455, partial [Desulfomicrobium escambiense]|nr:hypothetical protein [Desulfomicrobium escambiense]
MRYDLWDAFFTVKMGSGRRPRSAETKRCCSITTANTASMLGIFEARRAAGIQRGNRLELLRRGRAVAALALKGVREEVDDDINPRSGRILDLEITKAFNKLHSGEFADGLFRPIYDKDYFGRYTLLYEEFVGAEESCRCLCVNLSIRNDM